MKKTLIAFILIFAMLLTSCASVGVDSKSTSTPGGSEQKDNPIDDTEEVVETLIYTNGTYAEDEYIPAYSDKSITLHIPLINFTNIGNGVAKYQDSQGKKTGGVGFHIGGIIYIAEEGYSIDTIPQTGDSLPNCFGNGQRNFFPDTKERINSIDGTRETKNGYTYYYQVCIPWYSGCEYAETIWFKLDEKYYVSMEYQMPVTLFDEWIECLDNITFDIKDVDVSKTTE